MPPSILRSRFTTVARVWVIGQRSSRLLRHPVNRLEQAEVALLKPFRLVRRWRTGQEMLSLYRRTRAGPEAPRQRSWREGRHRLNP